MVRLVSWHLVALMIFSCGVIGCDKEEKFTYPENPHPWSPDLTPSGMGTGGGGGNRSPRRERPTEETSDPESGGQETGGEQTEGAGTEGVGREVETGDSENRREQGDGDGDER